MNTRQRLFVEQYVLNHNGTAVAIKAGYARAGAHVTASRLQRNPKVAALVAEQEQAAADRLAVTRERVLTELEKAIDVAREQRNPAAMIRGWAKIAKICGYYAPERQRVEVSVEGWKLRSQFEAMTDAELLALTSAEHGGSTALDRRGSATAVVAHCARHCENRLPLAMGMDEAPNPIEVSLVGAEGTLLEPNSVADAVEQTQYGRPIHCCPV